MEKASAYVFKFSALSYVQIETNARTVRAKTELPVSICREVIAVSVNRDFMETTVKKVRNLLFCICNRFIWLQVNASLYVECAFILSQTEYFKTLEG